jgi:glycosyltransferase involved in cell wall biosynthesis
VERVDATWRAPFTRIASSEWLRVLARERFGIDDMHVVPYGVDLEAFHPEPTARDAGLRVGLLHHVEEWKGVVDAVAAIERVRRDGRDVQVVAFGAFPARGPLPADAELHVLPGQDELRRLYSSLDVFLCASWSETGPMTVPEAMACGACVVSTDVGNVSLWTAGGEGAFVVPPRDADALASALARALDEPEERQRRAERGRELIQAFTWERAASEFLQILESAT